MNEKNGSLLCQQKRKITLQVPKLFIEFIPYGFDRVAGSWIRMLK